MSSDERSGIGMVSPVLSIVKLARDPTWGEVRRRRQIVVSSGASRCIVELVAVPSRVGELFYLLCPHCASRRRRLFPDNEGELRCRSCHSSPAVRLHPDQRASSGRFQRRVVRRARQVARLDARLARPGLDRSTRRRLRRRRQRLLDALSAELAHHLARVRRELEALVPGAAALLG